jgi:hypothetical protein
MSTETDPHVIDEPEEAAQPLEYRSVSALAILGLTAAAFSILTMFHWLFWLIPAAAIFLCNRAIKQIYAAPTEYTGLNIARTGIVAAVIIALTGHSIHWYIQKYTVPTGYKAITWDDLQPDSNNPAEIVPERAYDLQPSDKDRDRRVYIKGFINDQSTRSMTNIRQFILVPTASHCNFCQTQVKSTEMIFVKFTGGLTIDRTQTEIKLGGKFKIDPDQAANPLGGLPYVLEADYVQE